MKSYRQILTAGLCSAVLLCAAAANVASAAGDDQQNKRKQGQGKQSRGGAADNRSLTVEQFATKQAQRATKRFRRLDKDNSRDLAQQEYPDGSSGRLPRGVNNDPDFDREAFQQCLSDKLGQMIAPKSWDDALGGFDADNNEVIDLSEFRALARSNAIDTFAYLDADADGQLTRAERRTAKQRRRAASRECVAENDNGSGDGVPGSTAGIICDYVDSTYNDSESVQATGTSQWTCSETSRDLTANGIPDHAVGTFPNPANPNSITAQPVVASLTLTPTQTDMATELGGPRGPQGFVLNGIKIDAGTGGSCDDSGNCSLGNPAGRWSIEALGQTTFDFGTDENNAHVQPGGAYHYHGMPEGFIEKLGGNASTMTLIGWAADGFPIYARYGYSVADDATSELKSMTGSYQFIDEVSDSRPSTDDYPLGTFQQDWQYVAGSGDLDECNGREGVTPEFPSGIYHYYATDTYPFFQRCVKGEIEAGDGGGGTPPGDAPPPE